MTARPVNKESTADSAPMKDNIPMNILIVSELCLFQKVPIGDMQFTILLFFVFSFFILTDCQASGIILSKKQKIDNISII